MTTDTNTICKNLHTLKEEGGITLFGPYTVGKMIEGKANMVYLSGALGIDPTVKYKYNINKT